MSLALSKLGIERSEKWVRAAWEMGAPNLGKEGLLSDMLKWMRENPKAKPRAEIGVSNL